MRIDEILKGKKSVGISGHINPDGDCVGSVLGVYNYIDTYYPDVDLHVYLDPIPNIFKFLKNADRIETADPLAKISFDLFICCDCREKGRLGDAKVYFTNAKETLCIDHHLGQGKFATYEHIIPDASSACELVTDLMDMDRITKEIAECLYTGMVHDTGVFQYTCTSSRTMNIAGELMDKGIAYTEIIDSTFYEKTFDQNQILGEALLKAKLYANGKIIASYLSAEDMERHHVLPKHLDGIVSQLRSTKGVEVSVFMYQRGKSEYKVSTRAKGDINLAEIASKFGGGGHAKAAGFTVYEKPQVSMKKIIKEIEKALEKLL